MSLYQSETINELAAALAKAQGEMQHAGKDVTNTFFKSKYADLPSVFDAARPCLAKNGISVVQLPEINAQGEVVLMTQISHASGQWMRSWYPVKPVKNDPQGLGSAVTYARRYAYCCMVGVAAGDDDDGNAASGNAVSNNNTPKSPFKSAILRKTFLEMALKNFESATTVDELDEWYDTHSNMINQMKESGNEFDTLGVQELRNQFSMLKKGFASKDSVADSFGQGFAGTR